MKRQKLILLLSVVTLMSCSKSTKEKEEEATTLFEVFEYKTTTPVASVQIDLLRCSNYDPVFGCQGTGIVATSITDNNGRCTFKQSVFAGARQGSRLHKPTYWATDGHSGTNYIATEGWITLHLVRQNLYAFPRLFFRYYINGESGSVKINPFTVPVDTVIQVRAFGNQVNKLNWEIGTGIGLCFGSNPGFSNWCIMHSLANGILTLSLDRFGTSSLTLSY